MRQSIASLVSCVITGMVAGCGTPAVNSNPVLVNPTDVSGHSGGTDDVYEATQRAINSLVSSDGLRSHLEQKKGNRVVLNTIVNKTGIPGYDEKIIYNKFLANLSNNARGRLLFLNRQGVARERELQLSGQVKTTGVEVQAAGADLVLDIELLQLTSAQTKAIQYNFVLTDLTGVEVWREAYEIKKRT